jgi:hypothetical protein
VDRRRSQRDRRREQLTICTAEPPERRSFIAELFELEHARFNRVFTPTAHSSRNRQPPKPGGRHHEETRMTVTDSDRIAAPGVPITIDGTEQRLRYSFRSLKILEDHFGSIAEAADAINRVFTDGMSAKIIGDLSVLVPDTILDQLPGDDRSETILDAAVACSHAWAEAFPPLNPVPGKAEGEPDTTDSPGATSTTSSPSPAAAPTPPSGT